MGFWLLSYVFASSIYLKSSSVYLCVLRASVFVFLLTLRFFLCSLLFSGTLSLSSGFKNYNAIDSADEIQYVCLCS
jgi:hypothetical protein